MNPFFTEFIQHGRKLAEDRGINWDIPLDIDGVAKDGIGWNLTSLAGDTPPPNYYLRDFAPDKKATELLAAESINETDIHVPNQVLSVAWQDFIKAAVANQLFYRRNTPNHISNNVIRPLKVIATCVMDTEPWELSLDDLKCSVKIGTQVQASGKLGDLVKGIVKTVIDVEHIADACPLYPSLSSSRLIPINRQARHTKSTDELRNDLEERKRSERLPERRAFWELIRIVFTEQPKSFVDELRFTGLKVLLICGFRIGEAALLPADWKRTRDYFDHKGRTAGELGGCSTALMLRHFAEKQSSANSDSSVLTESNQFIPEIFADILTEALDRAVSITQPLRDTLKLQTETGRLLPWYDQNDTVRVIDLYPQLTGNPFWLEMDVAEIEFYINSYRHEFSPSVLQDLAVMQNNRYKKGIDVTLDVAVYVFLNRLRQKMKKGTCSLRFCYADGAPVPIKDRMFWGRVCLKIGELEEYIKSDTPTKVSDTQSMRLENGIIQPWEFMFLTPKRSLSEERNGGICDITKYFSVGYPDPLFIQFVLGGHEKNESIFERYGETEEDRKATLISHSLRHLQNTELFRLGIADTIITKRYNRRSVAQSYEYDHRSLAEELDRIDLPLDVEVILGEKASLVAKMIQTGKASGPVVDAFKRIQLTEGDDAAFQYLRGEADGFHATPFGHCLNSFTVDPCPKNLECFAGCKHLTATNLPRNREYLLKLEERLSVALETIQSRTSKSIGRQNQIRHAESRLVAVRKLLATPDNHQVFPNGEDFSKRGPERSIFDD